ncbi:uncharacterized protein LOC115630807 [Scaptodrosophila lebanonensis]|uniref:Uncharacterized protein LOC115630807 n=1 Tax=Drosophila lebanonensis TaxID=7225 RepID=A0A6J2U3X2_DROLE|nr:uncharacterized protein LOC115630807 [Scaptodrosophila lebanonensis]
MLPKSPRIRKYDINSGGVSDSSRNNSPRAHYGKTLINTSLKKRRTLSHGQRVVRKAPSTVNKETSQLLSGIPKAALLTPSSSDNSVTTTYSKNGVPTYTVQPNHNEQGDEQQQQQPQNTNVELALAKPTLPPYLTLKRQQSAAILNFRARKSVSQMDFKEARRTGNYQLVAHVAKPDALVPASKAMPQSCDVLSIQDQHITKMLLQDAALLCNNGSGNVRFVVSGAQDARLASLRIFNTIMLHAWRRRREEVRMLSEQVDEYKRSFVKNRNQLHVYNSLFSVEKRRNDTLNEQLKISYRDNAKIKLSYDELNIMLEQMTREKLQLTKENAVKDQDIENMQELHQNTQNDLFRVTTKQREQLEELTRSQRDYQDVEFEKKELTCQLEFVQIELSLKQQQLEQFRDNVALISEQLALAKAKLQDYKSSLEQQNSKLLELEEYKRKTVELQQKLQRSEEQLSTLQNCLAASVGQRIKQCFAQRQSYQAATYRMLHFVAYVMLPATPPPALHINSLPEAVGKLRDIFNSHFGGDNEKRGDDLAE